MDWLGVAVPRRGGGKAFEKPEAGRVTLAVAVEVPAVLAERVSQLRLARGQIGGTSAAAFPAFRRGYDRDAALTPIRQGDGGLMAPVELQELQAGDPSLARTVWTAEQRVGEELRALPIGSTFDSEGGIFYWRLGPGFLGDVALEFRAVGGATSPVTVRIPARVRPVGER